MIKKRAAISIGCGFFIFTFEELGKRGLGKGQSCNALDALSPILEKVIATNGSNTYFNLPPQ